MQSSTPPPVRARVEAYGRVQGIFYRDTLRRAALEHDVAGSAINRADLSVEAVFEGSQAAVDAMIEVARNGPPAARVDRLDVNWEDPEGLTDFRTGGPALQR